MKGRLGLAFAAMLALGGMQAPPPAAPVPVAMWRLDCGRILNEDRKPLPWKKHDLPVGCYLIQHGANYLLWDAGLSTRALGNAHPSLKLDASLTDQLERIGIGADRITHVGISHYHGDHTGQASHFPKATLVIGAADLQALKARPVLTGAAPEHLRPWISGGAPVIALTEDMDLFGDGSVTVLMTPGHTPGHLSLIVRLASRPVMLSGDLWASHDDVIGDDAPSFNTSHAETQASRARFRRFLIKLDAVPIIQHEVDDIDKLPPFPQAAH